MANYVVGIKTAMDLSESERKEYFASVRKILAYLGHDQRVVGNFCRRYNDKLGVDSCFRVSDEKLLLFLKSLTNPKRSGKLEKFVVQGIGSR